ncbi:MAG: ABC transporter substrate-binding protein, partial [Ancrocorticia sp.]|uniref:ABC transporter substrate-binding protein n=1 Tax=Ancrocorticia sp. TaxID=2593684 RepID=UPI003F8EB589
IAACGSNTTEQSADAAQTEGGDLVWAIETEPTTLNPQLNGGDAVKHVIRGLFDSYLYANEAGEYEPWLAEGYEVSEDGTTITLTLRDDVTFSNGEELDADAVVQNFDQLTEDDYASSSRNSLTSLTDYEAVDATTVEFTLSQPDALFLNYLSSSSSSPIAPESLESSDELESGGTTVYGTGPFTLESWNQGQEIVFAKRADYAWAPQAIANEDDVAYLDSVTYRILGENSTRTGALSSGQADVITGIPAVDVPLFDGQDGFEYYNSPAGGSPYSIYLNVTRPGLDDQNVREAIRQGLDLDTLLDSVYQGQVERAWSSLTPASPYYDESLEDSVPYDVEGANDLLDEAGWSERDGDGFRVKDGERLTVRAVSAAPYVRDNRDVLLQAIGASLRNDLGIDFAFEPVDLGTESERAEANDYELFDNSYGGSDPASSYDVLYSSDPARGFIARGNYDDDTLDGLLDEGRYSFDTEARHETYKELQAYISEEAYQIPLYVVADTVGTKDTVKGLTFDPVGGNAWSAYTVSKEG